MSQAHEAIAWFAVFYGGGSPHYFPFNAANLASAFILAFFEVPSLLIVLPLTQSAIRLHPFRRKSHLERGAHLRLQPTTNVEDVVCVIIHTASGLVPENGLLLAGAGRQTFFSFGSGAKI